MTITKPPQLSFSAASSPLCSLKGSLLTVAVLTFLSLFYLSLNSLRTPPPSPIVLESTIHVPQTKDEDYSDVYHSPDSFRLNYAEMERKFKIYIYPDGDPNTFFQTPRKVTGKYASEGYFFKNIRESHFRTLDPEEADLFFVPVSPHKMRGNGTSYEEMTVIVRDYVDGLIAKYPYWNRTLGADHFFVTCHDVGVRAFEGSPVMIKNTIRVVCSPSYNVGFIPHKDVALPQVLQPFALPAGGNDVENRTKFCICPGGSQVNSARITDSIHYGCVPVILSDYYDLPFSDILDWRKFAVVLRERDVYDLKQILKNITQSEFVSLHNNLVKVQKHFQWNTPPVKFDAFHMIMYELWLRHHVIKY
ncbi:hypothetical protein HID58_093384 [Brassica napus]|uniref:Exostosin GT47 domain-containing protein n=1 Tax=Brassica napus TaxID=3708 RepID=A0ABQ7XBJ2_BRANA|nr:hypothetical protein HID58_093384 [Brassica napus]